ncbi:MAG: Bro-N domain-containing protein [Phascolarctobacterium sp.]|nr:Bro-N domain-containing protein [Phascolarctobacterium sp.]
MTTKINQIINATDTQITSNPFEVFNHPDFGFVRVVMKDGEPWFVGKDVAETLGYKDTVNTLKKHVDLEDKGRCQIGTQFGEKETVIINESGLYSLVLRSKLPQARQFKRWVTSEVLPSIRKHGGYLTPDKVEEALLNPDTLINLALQLKKERQANERLQKDVDTLPWSCPPCIFYPFLL